MYEKKEKKENEKIEDQGQEVAIKPNMKGDYQNVAILLFLYLLQGND